MKLLLVANDFPPRVGGIQTYLYEIYRRVHAAGIEVTVLAPRFDGDAVFDANVPFEVARTGPLRFPTSRVGREVRAFARTVDVVALGATLPMAAAIAGKFDRPIVMHTHGFEVGWARLPLAKVALRNILTRATLVTVISEWTRHTLKRACGDTRIARLRTGVDTAAFPPDLDGRLLRDRFALGDRPVVSFVSRLVPRKGADQLLRALPRIRERIPDAALLIAGHGPDATRLKRVAADEGLGLDAVVFAGALPFAELPHAYAAGDVFAMPCRSRYAGFDVEGLGLVYLEAQACARPAITGDSGGAPEAIIDGETGVTVPGRDVSAIADAIAGLLADRERARAMGRAGRAFVEDVYDWDRIAEEYVSELRRL